MIFGSKLTPKSKEAERKPADLQ